MDPIHFEHHIQSEIFAKLRSSEVLRYKDLKDPLLESSQFMYHLTELMRRKLVEKVDKGVYRLTPKGVMLSQQFSTETGNLRMAPLSYSMIFLRSNNGNWLVLKRKKHPYIGMYACISGKMHMNETLAQAAEREINEITSGAVKVSLNYAGYASVLIKRDVQQTHITGPVWFADNVAEVQFPDLLKATPMWADWKSLPYEQFIPGWREIVAMIETHKPAYLDLSYNID